MQLIFFQCVYAFNLEIKKIKITLILLYPTLQNYIQKNKKL